MKSGRGDNPDHDRKSVEKPSGFREKRRRDKLRNFEIKQCGNRECRRWFHATPECFDSDPSSRTGLQSYDVQCKDEWETKPEKMYRRFRSFLLNEEPQSLSAWESKPGGSWAAWLNKYEAQLGLCYHCGAGLREWQYSGHNLDRKDNGDHTLHSPENTVLACHPCNITRGRGRWHAWRSRAKQLVDEHGWGEVPWGEIDDRFKRAIRRKCHHLCVPDPALVDPRQLSFALVI